MAATRGGIDEERLRALVARDLSVRAIAREVDRSPTTVRHWLGRLGLRTTDVARRSRTVAPRPRVVTTCAQHGDVEHVLGSDGRVRCVRCRLDAVAEWRRRAKRRLVEEAGGACAVCGFDRHPCALQFHHVAPETKAFGLAERGLTRSMDRLRAEAAKCVLVCANCHALIEAGVERAPSAGGRATIAGNPGRG